MRKIIPVLAFLLLGSFSACVPSEPGLSRLWFLTYSGGGPSEADSAMTPSSFLELKPDQSFTCDFGKFEYGRWTMQAQQLILNNQFGETVKFRIRGLTTSELQLQKDGSPVYHFDGQKLPLRETDPFSVAGNKWRLKAAGHESDQQLTERLRNHCAFWASYFTWALNNELNTVDVRSTPTPIKIYGNGFTIKPYADLPETWKSYFYDSTDCRRCNDLLVQVVKTHDVAWAHTDNRYKMFIAAFQQLGRFLK